MAWKPTHPFSMPVVLNLYLYLYCSCNLLAEEEFVTTSLLVFNRMSSHLLKSINITKNCVWPDSFAHGRAPHKATNMVRWSEIEQTSHLCSSKMGKKEKESVVLQIIE